MAKIETRYEMKRAGYTFKSNSTCKGCGEPIEWWLTNNKKLIPFDPIEEDDAPATPHWATCTSRDQFKRTAPAQTKAAQPHLPGVDPATQEKLTRELLDRTHARAAILITEEGSTHAWRKGIPGDDLRAEIITAANAVRNAISKGDQK